MAGATIHVLFPKLSTSIDHCKILSQERPDISFIPVERLASTDRPSIILADPACLKLFSKFPTSLKWIHSTWAGSDGYIDYLPRPLPFKVTRNAVYGQVMAEYTLGQIIVVERNFTKLWKQQQERIWEPMSDYATLEGRKCAILGYGQIGKEISRMLKFGVGIDTVAALVRNPRNDPMLFTDIDKLLEHHGRSLDFLINVLPSTNKTADLLTMERMNKLSACTFINIGRGDVVEDQVLLDCLTNGSLKQCVLDVFREEPLPKNHAFWSHDKIIVTPHCSGETTAKTTCDFFLKNLLRLEAGKELLEQVDMDAGY